MTPTQPTPEEQVGAQRIAELWDESIDELETWMEVGDPAIGQKLASAYLALLTQQSQERAWADQQVKRGDDEQIARKKAEAELDRAVEREEALRDFIAAHRCTNCIAEADELLAASPGKGAEGKAGDG